MSKKLAGDEAKPSNWDRNQERAFWEQLLNQKLNYFLIFFAVVLGGIFTVSSKTVSIGIQALSAIILWILALSIINTAHKLNIVIKSLSREDHIPTAIADRRIPGRVIKILYGYFLPVFCATIITVSSAASISGLYVVNFPNKTDVVKAVDSTIVKPLEKAKDESLEKKKIEKEESKYFKNIDSLTR